MDINVTPRGAELIEFRDGYLKRCSLEQSEAVGIFDDHRAPGSSFIWLGLDNSRMHLDREDVAQVVAHLQAWLACGSFAKGGA